MGRQAVWRQAAATPIPEEQRLTAPQLGTFERTLGVGDQFTARADTPHSLLNRADVPLTLVVVTGRAHAAHRRLSKALEALTVALIDRERFAAGFAC